VLVVPILLVVPTSPTLPTLPTSPTLPAEPTLPIASKLLKISWRSCSNAFSQVVF
jgi:hypothetical protein